MAIRSKGLIFRHISLTPVNNLAIQKLFHSIPFYDLYQNTKGQPITEAMQSQLKTKYPTLETLSRDRLQCSLHVLEKFKIDRSEACSNPQVLCMNPITLDNYGEILIECGFVNIIPKYLMRYHSIVRSHTIARHKKEGLMRDDIELEVKLQNCFQEWPSSQKMKHNFPDASTSILTVRLSVLENYLTWKLAITSDDFKKYCRNYLPLKHKPMHDIQEALKIAENDIKFDINGIRRNGFVISSDPTNTKLILQNVTSLAGFDIRDAIKIEPAILKNNYNSLIEIRNILEEYGISQEAQRRCLKVFCMCPKSVRKRLEELRNLKEYTILSTNPRVLSMVIHHRKMMHRLGKIQAARKQCYSLNQLVSSSKVFNEYITSFGNKVCGRDIAVLITSSLEVKDDPKMASPEPSKFVVTQLKRHKYWLHAALHVVDETIAFLKRRFRNEIILKNCQLLLYPASDVEQYIECLLNMRSGSNVRSNFKLDAVYNNLKCEDFTDDQILSLVLYEIEKKYHFSGDGIWAPRQDGAKAEALSVN